MKRNQSQFIALTEQDAQAMQTAKSTYDYLLRMRSWYDSAYRISQSSSERRDIAQQLAENATQMQLQSLLMQVYACTDREERDRLRREYARKHLARRPPARYWLRYLLIGVASAGLAAVATYAVLTYVVQ